MGKKIQAHLSMIGAEVLWGVSAPVGKIILAGGVLPMVLTDMRFVGAAVLFWIASLFGPKEHVPFRDMLAIFGASILAIVCNQVCFLIGLGITSPIDASIIPTTLPILTMLLAAMVLREPITMLKAGGVVIGCLGAVILIVSSNHDASNSSSIPGDLLILLSQFSFCCYLVFCKDLIARYSPVTLMKWMFTFASICVVPFTISDISAIRWSELTAGTSAGCIFYIVAPTFLSYLLLPIGQKNLRPTVTAIYNYIQPVVAVMVTILVGMGSLTIWNGVAMLLVFTGVFMVTRSRGRSDSKIRSSVK